MTKEQFFKQYYPDYKTHEAKIASLEKAWNAMSWLTNMQENVTNSKTLVLGNYEIMLEDWSGKAPKGNSVEIEGKWYYDSDAAMSLKFPNGYRLPTKKEWKEIYDVLGNNSERLQNELNLGLNGYVYEDEFNLKGRSGHYWSSSYYNTYYACYLYFSSGGSVNPQYYASKGVGFSVRCIRNVIKS